MSLSALSSLILAIIGVILASKLVVASNNDNDQSQSNFFQCNAGTIQWTKLTKPLTEWAYYKQMFKRVYANAIEEIFRRNIFMANSLRVYLHNVLFYFGQKTYYLSVNKYADRKRQELHHLYSMTDVGNQHYDYTEESLATTNDHQQLQHQRVKRWSKFEAEDDGNHQGHRLSNDQKKQLRSNNTSQDQKKSTDLNETLERLTKLDQKLQDSLASDDDASGDDESGGQVTQQIDINGLLEMIPSLNDTTFIDWRDSGCLTFVKDQLDCGSCYAFATVSLMEWNHCYTTGELLGFSEQYMVDCGSQYFNLNGCDGADLAGMGKFIQAFGVELRSKYPYSGELGKCPYSYEQNSQVLHHSVGHMKPNENSFKYEPLVSASQNRSIWLKLLADGPLLIIIKCPIDFAFYGGMIHDGKNCDQYDLHAMILVGDGVENGQEYWLLRNSHGYYWGESGYFRLSKDAPQACFGDSVNVKVNLSKVSTKESSWPTIQIE